MNRYEPLKIEHKWQKIWEADKKKRPELDENMADPLGIVNNGYGRDTLQVYVMFVQPYNTDTKWDIYSVGGVYRFLNRCWTLVFKNDDFSSLENICDDGSKLASAARNDGPARSGSRGKKNVMIRNKTIKKVTEDILRYNFNTAVAALMEYVNELYKTGASEEDLVVLAKLLKPFAPHLASEMLEKLGADDEWPKWEEKFLISDTTELIVQVNGKLRAKVKVSTNDLEDEEKIKGLVLDDERLQKYLKGGVKKTIFIKKDKLINLVV
ncbi:class I tRNA ligase family protein [Candidatus Saccharibacteria bacterium]|nr:class I tRNA ligase family protein [Candidatus Saccharibacteria bacterium]